MQLLPFLSVQETTTDSDFRNHKINKLHTTFPRFTESLRRPGAVSQDPKMLFLVSSVTLVA